MSDASEQAVALATALDKIRHQTTSNLVNQKRPATLLVALDATLTEQEAALTPVAYFAALLSTTQQLVAGNAEDTDGETLPAALYLLGIVLPCVNLSIVKSKSGPLLETLGPLLVSLHEQAATIKSLLSIFQAIYLSLDGSSLNALQAKQVFNGILIFLVDQRPKVRRKAQEAIQAMLANPPAPSTKHPYAVRIAEFVIESLKDALKEGKKGGKRKMQSQNEGAVSEEASRAIGLCAFIKMAGKDWPASQIGPLCALLLGLPRLGNPFLTGASYDILETLFTKSSDSFEEGKVEETLEAVLAARPTGNGSVDERILPGWLGTVEHGFVAFARSNPEACKRALLSTFNGVLCYLSSPSPQVRSAATSNLSSLLRYCVSDAEVRYAATEALEGEDDPDHPLRPICDGLLASLRDIKYQATAMPHALAVTSSLVTRLRTKCPKPRNPRQRIPAASLLVREHISLVGHMRSIEGFEYREAAETVLGNAVEVCGPEWVLDILPLNLGEESSEGKVGRAWLLPIFRTKITNTRMLHFTSYFVPLSEAMFGKYRDAEGRAESAEGEQAKKRAGIEAKIFEAVVQQIWALFPGYCDLPVDLHDAFSKQFCEILSNVVYSQAHLRPPIFRGLQLLVERNKAIAASASPSEVQMESFGVDSAAGTKNIQLLSGLAPNLLAVMFNVFSKASKQGRGYVLDAISAYLSILSAKDMVGTYNKIRGLLQQGLASSATSKPTPGESTVPQTMLDFLVQLVPYLPDLDTATSLLRLALSQEILQNKDSAVQKKAYRVLLRFCESGNTHAEQAIQQNLEMLVEELVEKNASVAASAKKDRTTLLATIIPLLPADKLHIIPSIIPEAVLATKEANEAARGAAFDLLVGMAQKMDQGGVIKRSLIKGAEGEEEDSAEMIDEAEANLQEYVTMVAAGLAGSSPHMMSATITALSRLLFEYHEQLPSETISEMLSTILIFLGSANREIVKSSVGFVKVAVVALAPIDIQPHLEALIPALLNWSHEHKNHFKLNIRHIFERLLRKFGYDKIESLTREEDRKLLVNIRKRQQRSKRKREQADAVMDGNGDSDDDVKPTGARNAYEEALYGSEDEDDSDEEEAPVKAPASRNAQQPALRKNAIGRRKQDTRNQQDEVYIQENEDEPLDLLDEKMVGRISRVNPAVNQARRTKRETQSAKVRTDSRSGKLVFHDEDGDGGDAPGHNDAEMDSTNAYLEAIRGEDGFHMNARGQVKVNKSTKRSRAQLEEDELVENVKDKLEGLGMPKEGGQRPKKPARKKVKESTGQEFKAKKAGGDVKKGDGINPYAYVPLGNGKKRSGLNIVNKGKKGR